MNYKMNTMPNAHCYVSVNGNRISLWSYNKMIIELVDNYKEFTLTCTGVYSPSTARHINRFCKELDFGIDYYFCKDLSKTETQSITIMRTSPYNPVRDLINRYRYNGSPLNQAAYDKAVRETQYKEMRRYE